MKILFAFAAILMTGSLLAEVVEISGEEKVEPVEMGGGMVGRMHQIFTNFQRDGKVIVKGVRAKKEIRYKDKVFMEEYPKDFSSIIFVIEGAEVAEVTLAEKPGWWVRASFPISVDCLSGPDGMVFWIVAPLKNFVECVEIKEGKVTFPMEDEPEHKANLLKRYERKMNGE